MNDHEFQAISKAIINLKRYLKIKEIIIDKDKYLELNNYAINRASMFSNDIATEPIYLKTFYGIHLSTDIQK